MSRQFSAIQKISVGSVFDIMVNRQKPKKPIAQILEIIHVNNPKYPFKYKASISDTKYFISAMLSNNINEKIEASTIRSYSIVELSEYNLLPTFNQNVLIISDMELILQERACVGHPENIFDFSKKSLISPQEQLPQIEVLESNKISLNQPLVSSQSESTSNLSQPAFSQGQLSLISPVSATVINPPRPIPASQPLYPNKLPIGPPLTKPINDISMLTPFRSNWTILARVVMKSHKCKSVGKNDNTFFIIILKDKSGSEIRGFFSNEVLNTFYDKIEENQVYQISGGAIRDNTVQTIDHDYEIRFNKNSKFNKMPDDDSIGKYPTFHFKKLNNLTKVEGTMNTYADIIGYIVENQEPKKVLIQKTNETKICRTLIICDDTNTKCEVNLWDEDAEGFPNIANRIVAFKDIIVCDIKGRSLRSPLKCYFEPDIPEVQELRNWLQKEGIIHDFGKMKSISKANELPKSYMRLSQIDELGLGTHGVKEFATCIFTVGDIPWDQKMYYPACPSPLCKHKSLVRQPRGFYCNKCQKFYAKPEFRFAFSLKAQDFTGSANFTYFGNDITGVLLTGTSPDKWAEMTRDMDSDSIREYLIPYFFEIFKGRVSFKKEHFNNVSRIKCTLESAEPINFAEEACFLANEIRKYD